MRRIDTVEDGALQLPACIPDLLRERAARFARRPAYIAFGTALSYRTLLRHTETLAAWLQAQGVQPGDRVALLLPNCLAFPVAAFGALMAGAVLAPLNPLYTQHEIADALGRLDPRLIVASPLLAGALPEDLDARVVSGSLGDGHGWKAPLIRRAAKEPAPRPGAILLASILERPRRPAPQFRDPGDLAMLQATGGSTGAPKYARLTEANLMSALAQLLHWSRDHLPPATRRRGLTVLAALPLYHAYGFIVCALETAAVGGCSILLPDARRLDDIAAAWRRYEVEVFPGVNTLFRGLLGSPAFRRALRRRRPRRGGPAPLVTAGGMALAEATAKAWREAAGYPILQGYGSAETASAVSCSAPGCEYDGCIGRPLTGTLARIRGAGGEALAPGQVGELQLKGDQISPGYWGGEEADAWTADGWFRTGDLALEEPDGRLRIMGRLKELVIVSGFNVYPLELEACLQAHPAVAECAAVGEPDARTGEAVVLFAVLRPGGRLEEVAAFAQERLAGYKRPRRYVQVEALPKTPVGKILKTGLMKDFHAGRLSVAAVLESGRA